MNKNNVFYLTTLILGTRMTIRLSPSPGQFRSLKKKLSSGKLGTRGLGDDKGRTKYIFLKRVIDIGMGKDMDMGTQT